MKSLLFMLGTLVLVQGVEVKTSLLLRSENTFYTDDASLQKAEGYARLKITLGMDDGSKLTAVGSLRGDLKSHIYPGRFETDNYADASKPQALGSAGVGKLRELYYEKSFGSTALKVGKMQSVWGKADGIKLLDVLNPQDFSEFILPAFEESRIPQWTLSLLQTFDNAELELLWIPDTSRHKLPQSGGDYSFSTPRIIPRPTANVRIRQNPANTPDDTFKDSDIALRYTANMEELELSFYGLYAYDDAPVLYQDFDLSTFTVTLNPKYERYTLFGASMDYASGDFVYRVEAAYTSGKYFLNSQAPRGVSKSDTFSYVFGVDWYGLEETVLSMQLNQSYLLTGKRGFVRPKIDNTVTFLYKKELRNNTLHAEVLLIHNINDGDGLLRPKLSYEWDEETLIYVGVDYFYGDKEGLYGEFKDKSRVILGIERTF